jgi:KAP family P-loop domain
MSAQSQSPQSEFTIAVGIFHEQEYRNALLQILEQQGLHVISTNRNDAENGRLMVRSAAAYVAVIGYAYGPIPDYENPEQRFLIDIELSEALRLGLPILLLIDGVKELTESESELRSKVRAFRKLAMDFGHNPSIGHFSFTFYELSQFQNKAIEAIALLRKYLEGETPSTKTQQAAKAAPNFSKAAERVLERARELVEKSERAGVTSSCVLFALSELATDQNDTSHFVRATLERTGRYDEAFKKFLEDAGNPERASESKFHGLAGRVSKNVEALLSNASGIAARVSRGTDSTIFPRHIFTALLVTPAGERNPVARRRLTDLGIKVDDLCSEFLEFIRKRRDISEDSAGWAAVLTTKVFQSGPAGYNSEFCGLGGDSVVEDQLGVGGWADQLAELIALRETKLPLAVGLFGNWGSGKSHFMNLIDHKLKTQMEVARREGNSSRWCTEIVPVYFNAWHYLDANLWASLVSQIFESLFLHLKPKADLKAVQELLEQASGATARAAEEVKVAEAATRVARDELQTAEQSRRDSETFAQGLLNGLKHLFSEADAKKIQDEAATLLGVEKKVETVDDLRRVVDEIHSLTARVRALGKRLWQQPGRGWRLGRLSIAVVSTALIAYIFVPQIPFLRDRLQGVGQQIAALLGAVSAFILWLLPLLAQMNKRVKQMDAWVDQAEQARRDAPGTQEVKDAQIKVTAATAKEEDARIRLGEAARREQLLREEALNLEPERRLGRFIEQRAQSQDYRGQLGLVSLARRDFQELSEIFAKKLQARIAKANADNEAKLKELSNSTLPDKDARQEDIAKAHAANIAKLEELTKSIDRIVLFVDDLDRCQPDKIVEVLQAVHLLLAFPLFAVVVGVDQRRLRQSLGMHLTGLLTQEDERPATPLDYLEKIFHVPFHLPPMHETGFRSLIDRLTEPMKATPDSPPPPPPKPTAESKTTPAPPQNVTKDHVEPKPPHHVPADKEKEKKVEPTPTAQPGSISQTLQRWEREALQAYHPLIQTPRGAKRLLNTYRLVRASVPQSEWAAFAGDHRLDGEFRVAMLLLAAAAGYPAVARSWFAKLIRTNPAELFEEQADDPEWSQFKKVYEATFGHFTTPVSHEIFIKWINRVERFAF